jgi:colanic acid biosynthesis glycosyl transferase WcaI
MPRPLRIGIVGLNYAPETIGIARYTTDMAISLAQRGHEVNVVAGKPYYPAWRIADEWRGGGARRSHEDGVEITRCSHYVPATPTGPRRILHLLSFTLSALAPALRMARGKPDVVICVVPALLSVPAAWLAARLGKGRLWIHVQDFEVEASFATGLVSPHGLLGMVARRLENRLLALADVVSSISPQMCARAALKGIAPERIVEIRNWTDVDTRFTTPEDSPLRRAWALGDRKVCLYSGNIANKQGIEILIEVARLLHRRRDIAFVICGQGPNRARLETLAQGLDNIQFHDLQPMEAMGALLGLANVHLLPQIPGAADLVLPSKLTNMLASGRPVVATAETGTGLWEEVDGCGLCVMPGDAAAMAAAIERLIDQPDLAASLGQQGKARASERWSRSRMIDRLEAHLRDQAGHSQTQDRAMTASFTP